MPSRNHNKVHGKHRGRSNFRPFTVTLYINTVQKSIIETVVEERIFVAYYNDPKERANVRYEFKLSNPCENPMMRKYIETHIDELIYMLPGGGITFMYNPDDNRTVGYITRIE